MEWLTSVRKALEYIEEHLHEDISVQDIADSVNISEYIFCKGFAVMTGYSVSEYIRNRRLYLSALEVRERNKNIIDIAFDYGYETPESYTKAFTRFHKNTPSAVKNGASFVTFLPLKINIIIQGGNKMDCKIKKMSGIKLVGIGKEFNMETSHREIPKFWDEFVEKYAKNVYMGNPPQNEYERAIVDNNIGEYAVCIDEKGSSTFRYLIAGKYNGGEIPSGMEIYEFEECDWAIFDCIGKIPKAFQSLSTKIFKEWLPGNPEYELCKNATIEWYSNGDMTSKDYHSAIWLPVKRK